MPSPNTQRPEGLEERISHPCILCSPKLISFSGFGNGIGQRHLAVAGWGSGDGWDEPLCLMRTLSLGLHGEPPAMSQLPGSRQVKGLVGAESAVRPFYKNVSNDKIKAKGLGTRPRSLGNITQGNTLEEEWCRKHELSSL